MWPWGYSGISRNSVILGTLSECMDSGGPCYRLHNHGSALRQFYMKSRKKSYDDHCPFILVWGRLPKHMHWNIARLINHLHNNSPGTPRNSCKALQNVSHTPEDFPKTQHKLPPAFLPARETLEMVNRTASPSPKKRRPGLFSIILKHGG